MNRICTVSLSALALLSTAAADNKIKTRTTVAGHASESTAYVKGARERNETSMGMAGMSLVNLTQCDKKRIITINPQAKTCMIVPLNDGQAAAEAAPTAAPPGKTRKGGLVTFSSAATDTGERQKLFGLTARRIKTTMTAESGPGACTPANMRMETDGWYADISPEFTCRTAAPAQAQMPQRPECQDQFRYKRSGTAKPGYPLKQTTTMTSGGQTFTINTEVVELTAAPLDASLFEMPAGCRVVTSQRELMGMPSMSGMMGGQPPANMEEAEAMAAAMSAPPPVARPQPAAPPAQPAPPAAAPAPASTVAPKGTGVVRVGVVKIKDLTGQYLPIDNLRINLLSEITKRNMEAVPLDAEAPHQTVLAEAREKQCDYVLYTDANQVKDPGSGGLPRTAVPRGITLSSDKYQALLDMTLWKVGKPVPEPKDLPIAEDAEQLAVNAVMEALEKEAEKVAEQVKKDAEARRAPARAAPAKAPARPTKKGPGGM